MNRLPEYLCPDDYSYWCMGKNGCVVDETACKSKDATGTKPGFKTTMVSPIEMISKKLISGDNLFRNLSNIVPWITAPGTDNTCIRFCASIVSFSEKQPIWAKIVFKHTDMSKNQSYEKSKKENSFFKSGLTNYTPHIVSCIASLIEINPGITIQSFKTSDEQILMANIKAQQTQSEKAVAVFYMQPKNWVYLETFLKGTPYIVTENTLVSIMFQVVYTLACIQTKNWAHNKLNMEKTIALDINPCEKYITYYFNNEAFRVPINVKVIILNWEDALQEDPTKSNDVKTFFERFFALVQTLKHPNYDALKRAIISTNSLAHTLLDNDLFKRFKGTY